MNTDKLKKRVICANNLYIPRLVIYLTTKRNLIGADYVYDCLLCEHMYIYKRISVFNLITHVNRYYLELEII